MNKYTVCAYRPDGSGRQVVDRKGNNLIEILKPIFGLHISKSDEDYIAWCKKMNRYSIPLICIYDEKKVKVFG